MGLESNLVKSSARRAGHVGQRPRERGVAVVITLLLVLGVSIGLVTSGVARTIPLKLRAENKAMLAIAEAKQALIGRAAADDDRPGSLPCPDAVTNLPAAIPPNVPNDGIADVLPAP